MAYELLSLSTCESSLPRWQAEPVIPAWKARRPSPWAGQAQQAGTSMAVQRADGMREGRVRPSLVQVGPPSCLQVISPNRVLMWESTKSRLPTGEGRQA